LSEFEHKKPKPQDQLSHTTLLLEQHKIPIRGWFHQTRLGGACRGRKGEQENVSTVLCFEFNLAYYLLKYFPFAYAILKNHHHQRRRHTRLTCHMSFI